MGKIRGPRHVLVKTAVDALRYYMAYNISNKTERYAFDVIFDNNIKEFFDSVEVDFSAARADMDEGNDINKKEK